jgi:large subunit ribosomal protein L17
MASSLILHKRITTTVAKAKALRGYVEPLITKSKEDTTHSRRVVFSYLQDKDAVTELFREVSKKVGDRPGGYTRIIKLGNRLGDNADMAMMELVDYNENLLKETKTKKTSTRRRRGGKKKTTDTVASPAEKVEEVKEEVVEETPKTEETPVADETTEAPAAEEKTEEPKAEAKDDTEAEEKK